MSQDQYTKAIATLQRFKERQATSSDEELVALNAFLDQRDYEKSGAKAADRITALEKRVNDLERRG